MSGKTKRIAHKIWNLNWNVYQRLKPLLLVISTTIALLTLLAFEWKYVIHIGILGWVLCLAYHDFLKKGFE